MLTCLIVIQSCFSWAILSYLPCYWWEELCSTFHICCNGAGRVWLKPTTCIDVVNNFWLPVRVKRRVINVVLMKLVKTNRSSQLGIFVNSLESLDHCIAERCNVCPAIVLCAYHLSGFRRYSYYHDLIMRYPGCSTGCPSNMTMQTAMLLGRQCFATTLLWLLCILIEYESNMTETDSILLSTVTVVLVTILYPAWRAMVCPARPWCCMGCV